jgi:hypothetical protein
MVKVGDKIPSATLKTMSDSGMQDITTEELTTGKKVRAINAGGGNSKLQPACGADLQFATSSIIILGSSCKTFACAAGCDLRCARSVHAYLQVLHFQYKLAVACL